MAECVGLFVGLKVLQVLQLGCPPMGTETVHVHEANIADHRL